MEAATVAATTTTSAVSSNNDVALSDKSITGFNAVSKLHHLPVHSLFLTVDCMRHAFVVSC